MTDKRRARRAKQARRDKRRAKKRTGESSAEPTLTDAVRSALGGHPVDLLGLASTVIHVAKPEPLILLKSRRRDTPRLDEVLTGLIGVQNRETTALLAVIAELLVDDPELRLRCQQELAERDEHLPRWIAALPQVDVYRAVRISDVLGDVDEVVIGARLNGGHELSVAVLIDHNTLSGITDIGIVPDPIDEALARAAEASTDTDVVEMRPADARAWIDDAFTKPAFALETDSWPFYRALVRWLVDRLPEGGEHRPPAMNWQETEELRDAFFTTDSAAPFTDPSHRELLLELLDDDRDPLRSSAARVEQAISDPRYYDDRWIPLEVALDAPDLLRAFIPYAHAQSGIRDELTSRTLATIDKLRSRYKREVLMQAQCWDIDDAV